METWLGQNWWWLLPAAILPVAITASINHHKRILRSMPENRRSRVDAIAKQALMILARLFGGLLTEKTKLTPPAAP